MMKFFRLHDYSKNIKARVATFSLKGKANIWWEAVKNIRCIHEKDLTWSEFERLFKKKYLLERYFDDRVKEFYELKMGSMTNEEYTSRFLELLRYVPYLTEEKAKMQRSISGLSVAFKDRIEFDEPKSLEEIIQKLRHCYEQSKRISKTKPYWKGNARNKGKWDKKRTRPHGTNHKDNVATSKKFKSSDRGKGH